MLEDMRRTDCHKPTKRRIVNVLIEGNKKDDDTESR